MEGPLISVIVPVYKTEAYLDRCVQSIVNQTYRNLEIILVDDGSPDNCPSMCDAWAERDGRIKVIHTPNGGVSSARNIGLHSVSGKYICFVDSDDWIEICYIELLYRAIQDNNALLAACKMNITNQFDVCTDIPIDNITYKLYTSEEALSSLIMGRVFQGGPCDKMYHQSILENISFKVGRRHEDEFFTFRVIDQAKRLVYVDAALYNYFQRDDSFMHSGPAAHLDALDAYLERIVFLNDKYPALCTQDKIVFCKFCVSLYCDFINSEQKDTKKHTKRIMSSRKKVHFSISELHLFPIKDLLYVLGSMLGMPLFAHVLNAKRKRGTNRE